MSTHNYNIINQAGAAARADINNALLAIVSNNSSATEPAVRFAYQFWADTTTGILKQRNAANTAWINLIRLSTGFALSAEAATTATNQSGGTVNATTSTFGGLMTLNGGQIKFPATQIPSADANTLDDYEEGTWTPSVGGTATYSGQLATYTKVGRLVNLEMRVAIATIGTGSTNTVSGLPFTFSAGQRVGTVRCNPSATAYVSSECYLDTTQLFFGGRIAASTFSNGLTGMFGNGADVYANITASI